MTRAQDVRRDAVDIVGAALAGREDPTAGTNTASLTDVCGIGTESRGSTEIRCGFLVLDGAFGGRGRFM